MTETEDTRPRARSRERVVPSGVKDHEIWLLWAPEHGKVPMAPWITGHCYPVSWGADADPRPETDFETVKRFADLPPATLHQNHSFPPTDDSDGPLIPDETYPTIYLPHDPPDPPLMLIDFDDVRDPETGAITREVFQIIDQLDAYAEVSSSGTGLHAFVRAELPGALGKFIADLDDEGHIEMYDHGRMVGCTWEHVAGTPTEVPERQTVIDALVREYETETLRNRRKADATRSGRGGEGADQERKRTVAERIASATGDGQNPYFDLPIRQIADTGAFAAYRTDPQNPGTGDWTGPHPGHGATSSHDNPGPDDQDSTNFAVEPREGVWYCHAHGIGGGALALLGVLEGVVRCDDAKRVYRDGRALLKTCLYARERFPDALDEATAPRKALAAVADEHDLGNVDNSDTRRVAAMIFSELSPDDVAV